MNFNEFLSMAVTDCVNARTRNYDDSDMTAEEWLRQDRYDRVEYEEYMEKAGRFSGPNDDYRTPWEREDDDD